MEEEGFFKFLILIMYAIILGCCFGTVVCMSKIWDKVNNLNQNCIVVEERTYCEIRSDK